MFSATLLVTIGAHVFVASWLLTVSPWLRQHRRAFTAAVVALFLMAPVGRLFGAFYWKGLASSFSAGGTTEWMTVMLAAIPLTFVVVLSRVIVPEVVALLPQRRAVTPAPVAAGSSANEPADAPPLTRRVAIERAAGLVAFGASGAALGWGALVGRHEFRVEEVVVRLPGLPKALEGYTIAQISDIHAGLFVGERELEEGFSKVRALRPDLVVATGDLVDYDARYAPWLARRLGDLRGRDGVVAILGNHDYYAGYTQVMPAMRAAGVDLLLNEGRMIRPRDGGGFALLGVDDLWATRSGGAGPDLDRALSMVRPDAAKVLLAHQPNYFSTAKGKVGLQLSGHTHGGQINPGFRPADLIMRYVSGRYDDAGSTMWVNRGFGVAGPPSRIGAPPEVTKIVLVSA
jgi:predicted MPP superfamily phosphohydrolase